LSFINGGLGGADFGDWEVPKEVGPNPKKVTHQKASAKKAVSEKQRIAKNTMG